MPAVCTEAVASVNLLDQLQLKCIGELSLSYPFVSVRARPIHHEGNEEIDDEEN